MALNINQYTGYPPFFVKGYIVSELQKFGILSGFEQMVPIFPTSPTNIEDVFNNYIGAPGIQDPLLIQYERLLRMRKGPMYVRKCEQLVLYLYCTNLSKVLDAHRIISEALDREDAAAQDVNAWLIQNDIFDDNNVKIEPNVFFHNFRVYQTDETRDLLELASARTVYANKLIIEYDYHVKKLPSDPLYT
jgi:hypothetical protein